MQGVVSGWNCAILLGPMKRVGIIEAEALDY